MRYRVALIVETSVVYGRQILRGISDYMSMHGQWSVFLDERELGAPPPSWIADWKGDGIICRSTTPELAKLLHRTGTPVVDLNDRFGDLGFSRIGSDMEQIGRLAAEHLLERGFNKIAFCGFEDEAWSDSRLDGVSQCCEVVSVFRSPWKGVREHSWDDERDRICEWLLSLPRPLGIVACNDVRAHHILDACQFLDISVPEQIAVIGVDNSETLCALCNPPLSSVMPDARRIGFEAGQMLNDLMDGKITQCECRLIPAIGVITRQSTDSFAIDDPLVATALQFIRENTYRPLSVDDLLEQVKVSRSSLERRFRESLGKTPHDMILRARIQRMKALLRQTDWPLEKIAHSLGFEHAEYMMVQFRRETGLTPSEWRVTDNLS